MNIPRVVSISILAGAILNGLVAWVLVLWSPYSNVIYPPRPEGGGHAQRTIGPRGILNWWKVRNGCGVWEAIPMGSMDGRVFRSDDEYTPAFYRAGLPLFSLQSVVTGIPPEGGNPHDYDRFLRKWELPLKEILYRGMQTRWLPQWMNANQARRIPLLPFFPGFAANTLLYSCMVFLVWAAWHRIRKQEPNNKGGIGA